MKEDLDEEVQGEEVQEVEPNQGWSLVFETHMCFFCEKNLEKNP